MMSDINGEKHNKSSRQENGVAFIKGAVIGGTMLVPGVSGGSMAMILGIYDRLIGAVGSFLKDVKCNFMFLCIFALGGAVGMVVLSNPISYLMEHFNKPFMYFFLGAVAGSIPMVYRHAKVKDKSWISRMKQVGYLLIGIAIVMNFAFMPEGTFVGGDTHSSGNVVIQLVAGVIAAVALVLPGISVSYMLVLMGIYDSTVNAISRLDIFYLLPMGFGLFLGIVLITKLLEGALTKYPEMTYLVILGFMIGSVVQVFPGLPEGIMEWILCVNLALAGFGVIFAISNGEGATLE